MHALMCNMSFYFHRQEFFFSLFFMRIFGKVYFCKEKYFVIAFCVDTITRSCDAIAPIYLYVGLITQNVFY